MCISLLRGRPPAHIGRARASSQWSVAVGQGRHTHTRSGSQRAGSVAAVSARQSAEQVVGSEEEEEQQQRSAILLASLRPDLSLSPLPHWASNLHEVAAAIITPEYNAPVILTELPVRQEPNILLARSGQFGEIFVEIF